MKIRGLVVATLGAVCISWAAGATILSAQGGSTAAQSVVYRGCLNTGSADGTFVLSKAAEKGQKGKEKVTLKVTPATDKVKLGTFLLRDVEITGTLEAPAGAATSAPSEGGEVLRTLSATKVSWKADYCG